MSRSHSTVCAPERPCLTTDLLVSNSLHPFPHAYPVQCVASVSSPQSCSPPSAPGGASERHSSSQCPGMELEPACAGAPSSRLGAHSSALTFATALYGPWLCLLMWTDRFAHLQPPVIPFTHNKTPTSPSAQEEALAVPRRSPA